MIRVISFSVAVEPVSKVFWQENFLCLDLMVFQDFCLANLDWVLMFCFPLYYIFNFPTRMAFRYRPVLNGIWSPLLFNDYQIKFLNSCLLLEECRLKNLPITVGLQPQCGIYMYFHLPSFFIYRPGDRMPTGYTRIARLQACVCPA